MADFDCRRCKRWKGCTHDGSWFHYGELRFCPLQVVWIITHKEELKSGRWPQDPYGSNDSNSSQRSIKTEASFVKPELVIAEVEARLDRTPNKGELLITQIEDGRSLSNLSDGARAILMYVKGFRRKDIGYRRWLRVVYHTPNITLL